MTTPAPTALHDAIIRLGGRSEERVLALFDRLVAGELQPEEFTAGTVSIVGKARALAYGLADVSLAATVTARTGRAAPTLGVSVPADDADRLALGVSVLVDARNEDGILARVARYARAEPYKAFQDAFVEGLQARDIPGYVRALSPKACQLCIWLYRDGYVYPADRPFRQHAGCACYPSPQF